MEVIGTVGIVVPSDQTGVSSIYCWTVFAAVGFTAQRRNWCTQKSNSILETLSTHNRSACRKSRELDRLPRRKVRHVHPPSERGQTHPPLDHPSIKPARQRAPCEWEGQRPRLTQISNTEGVAPLPDNYPSETHPNNQMPTQRRSAAGKWDKPTEALGSAKEPHHRWPEGRSEQGASKAKVVPPRGAIRLGARLREDISINLICVICNIFY